MGVVQVVIDAFTALTHKTRIMGDGNRLPDATIAPTWVPDSERRRLAAYILRAAYQRNVARHYLAAVGEASDDRVKNHREYGDASVIVETCRAAVVGETPQIVVDGADDDAAHAEPWEGEGDPPPGTPTAEEITAAHQLVERQAWLEGWADDELFAMKCIETERNAGGLGDGVYWLGWSPDKRRCRLHVSHPQFYFPVLGHASQGDYPPRVHLAYEFERELPGGTKELWVRRQTWELGAILPLVDPDTGEFTDTPPDGARWRTRRLRDGVTIRELVRALPWNPPDRPATVTCYYSDAEWRLADQDEARKIDDLAPERAVVAYGEDGTRLWRVDLGLDFIPVDHVSNTVAIEEHYGVADLDNVAQLLDDIQAADTDLAAATAVAGRPTIGVTREETASASQLTAKDYKPGGLIHGAITTVDTSQQTVAIVAVIRFLLERLSTNTRLPESVLGRVSPADVPSGIALLLSFGPFRSLIEEKRLVRRHKYGLLFKFVQRWTLLNAPDELPPVPAEFRGVADANLAFGSYLPTDVGSVVEWVVRLLAEHGLSRRSALHLLVAAGMELPESIAEELEAIDHDTRFDRAAQVLDLTDDETLARETAGLPAPPPEPETGGPPGGPVPIPPIRPGGAAPGGPGGPPGAAAGQ